MDHELEEVLRLSGQIQFTVSMIALTTEVKRGIRVHLLELDRPVGVLLRRPNVHS